MTKLRVVDRSGAEATLEVQTGLSVMEAIRDNGYDQLLALCGGSCSCATCHVYVDPDWLEKTGGATPDENELLESSSHRRDTSRLACQIEFTALLEGLRVEIAPED